MGGVIVFDQLELQSLAGKLPRGKGCDFCATGLPAWRYLARDVGLGTVIYGNQVMLPVSLGAWRACIDCADLVDCGDWPALARRCLRSLNLDLSSAGPGMRVRLLAQIRSAHESFRQARSAPRTAI